MMKSFAYMPVSSKTEPPDMKTADKWRVKVLSGRSTPSVTLLILWAVFLIGMIVRLSRQPEPFVWLSSPNGADTGTFPADVGLALAPILALALFIERVIETVFDFFESNIKEVAKRTTGAAGSLEYIDEMRRLYTKLMLQAKSALQAAIAGGKPQEEQDIAVSMVRKAEQLLLDAGGKLDNLPKDPMYISWKRALSIRLGLTMGMVVAVFFDQGVFYYQNLNVPRIIEMLLTGFGLGAGSGPLHSLVGILQGAKDALAGLAKFNGKGLDQLNQHT